MGWPAVRRVWLPDWLTDRDRVVADLVEAAYAATETVHQVGETRVASSWEVYAPPADDAATDSESDTAPRPRLESDSEPAPTPRSSRRCSTSRSPPLTRRIRAER